MKKVLIIFGETQFSDGAFDFARHMNEMDPIMLSGVFLPHATHASLFSYGAVPVGIPPDLPVLEEMHDNEEAALKRNVDEFEKRCRENGISFRSHFDIPAFAASELATQTRFSDLLIISSEKFYENIVGEDAEDYLRDVLNASECPVVIVPEHYEFPTRNVFAYDGSGPAVFAARQYMQLFPKLCTHGQSTFVYVDEDDEGIPNEAELRELAEIHLPNHDFLKLDINPRKLFSNWIAEQKRSILIGGFTGRPRIGKVFGKKVLNKVIAEHMLPLFMVRR